MHKNFVYAVQFGKKYHFVKCVRKKNLPSAKKNKRQATYDFGKKGLILIVLEEHKQNIQSLKVKSLQKKKRFHFSLRILYLIYHQ